MLTTSAALSKDRRNTGVAPSMQHRHFAWIAGELAAQKPHLGSSAYDQGHYDRWFTICASFADSLNETNPNFDHDRFMKACGA